MAAPKRICAWCHRMAVADAHGETTWVYLDPRAYHALHAEGNVTHGVCPACAEDLLNDPLAFLGTLRSFMERVLAAAPGEPVMVADDERAAMVVWLLGHSD